MLDSAVVPATASVYYRVLHLSSSSNAGGRSHSCASRLTELPQKESHWTCYAALKIHELLQPSALLQWDRPLIHERQQLQPAALLQRYWPLMHE